VDDDVDEADGENEVAEGHDLTDGADGDDVAEDQQLVGRPLRVVEGREHADVVARMSERLVADGHAVVEADDQWVEEEAEGDHPEAGDAQVGDGEGEQAGERQQDEHERPGAPCAARGGDLQRQAERQQEPEAERSPGQIPEAPPEDEREQEPQADGHQGEPHLA
jgi:hypothetical protein